MHTAVVAPVRCQVDIEVTRGDLVESRHRVHAAVTDADGRLVASAGDAQLTTHWRSCAKPLQVFEFVASGGLDAIGWSDEELALACASHGGEPEHVAIAERMLRSLGLDADALACGPHRPLAERGVAMLKAAGARATRLHNNCSGKHAAMMARARQRGWPTTGYHELHHPVQQENHARVAAWAGLTHSRVATAVDGCGVPVFVLPLVGMATAYARLVTGSPAPGHANARAAADRIVRAMHTHAFLVGGTGRFDTVLMEATDGAILAKLGAEGVHTLAWRERGWGIALKVEDGATRAQYPAVLALLQQLGALPEPLPASLAAFATVQIPNTRDEVVGAVRVAAHP
ncbi:MAG: asparaginase [Gemmatimonadaceae bacterium]|jgi:L-asparaginase II|nr:asparaginase [Gemmatimonadaceae bacterium]